MGLTNNDILKKIRVALKLRDDDIIRILGHVDYEITKSELGAFFRAEEHAKYMELKDQILRNFLNGLVIEKRGVMERKKPEENSAARKLHPAEPNHLDVLKESSCKRSERLVFDSATRPSGCCNTSTMRHGSASWMR